MRFITYSILLYPECKIVEALKDRQSCSSHLDLISLLVLLDLLDLPYYLIYLIYCITVLQCLLRLGSTKYSITV